MAFLPFSPTCTDTAPMHRNPFRCLLVVAGTALSHLHRHFQSVWWCFPQNQQLCPNPIPVALQGSGDWFKLEPRPAHTSHTLGVGKGELRSSSSVLASAALQAAGRCSAKLFNHHEDTFWIFIPHSHRSLPGKAMIWSSLTVLSLSNKCYFISSVLWKTPY